MFKRTVMDRVNDEIPERILVKIIGKTFKRNGFPDNFIEMKYPTS